MAFLRNFGHNGPEKFNGVGINGKNSEFHAAMGLLNLNYLDSLLSTRKMQYEYYLEKLTNFDGRFTKIPKGTVYNYSYFPLIFNDEDSLIKAVSLMERNKIYPRRYFYPPFKYAALCQ